MGDVLYQVLVEEGKETLEPSYFTIPEPLWDAYVAKAHIYRQATLLFALLTRNEGEPRCEPIVRAVEKHIFPQEPNKEGTAYLAIIKAAMGDIAELVDPSNERKLTWSAHWLRGIGCDDPNLVDVALFGTAWMDYYIAVRNSIHKMPLP